MGKGIMDIGVVIVTFNRVEKLKTALLNFDVQSILPDTKRTEQLCGFVIRHLR